MTTIVGSPSDVRTNLANNHPNGKSGRSRSSPEESFPGTRFFLSKPSTNTSALELGKECANEGEARVEALKAGLTYYSLQEWRPVADFAGRNPELKREPVRREVDGHAQQ